MRQNLSFTKTRNQTCTLHNEEWKPTKSTTIDSFYTCYRLLLGNYA